MKDSAWCRHATFLPDMRLSFPIFPFANQWTNEKKKKTLEKGRIFFIWVKGSSDVCRCPRGFQGKSAVALAVPVRTIKNMINIVVTFLGNKDKAVKSRKLNNRIENLLQKQEHERV